MMVAVILKLTYKSKFIISHLYHPDELESALASIGQGKSWQSSEQQTLSVLFPQGDSKEVCTVSEFSQTMSHCISIATQIKF